MIFTRIPQNYASLSGPAVFGFRNDGPARTLDVEIVDARTGVLLAARRFYRAATIEIDVAPVLRRSVGFDPSPAAATGFRGAEDRCARVFLRVEQVESPVRTFLACERPAAGVLATDMPAARLLGSGEQEELTLLPGAASVEVTAHADEQATAYRYAATDDPYPQLFRLCADDFPQARRLTLRVLSAGGAVLSTLRYGIAPPPPGGVRLAWHGRSGAVEHYTFPIVRTLAEEQRRTTAEGALAREFVAAEGEERLTLLSAYEPKATLRALAAIGTAPRIWIADGGIYRRVEVLPAERSIVRHGTLRAMEVTLLPHGKGESLCF